LIVIPKLPQKSKAKVFIYALPVSLRVALVIALLPLAWHFRYFEMGVPVTELTKIPGELYGVSCIKYRKRHDSIVMYTSLQEEEVHLSGEQKCNNISHVFEKPLRNMKVVFYTYRNKGILAPSPEGSLYIVAVDALEPSPYRFIYPEHELGVRYEPNVFGVFLLLAAFFLAFSLYLQRQELKADKLRSKS
jgi:hypothetical protein